MQVNKTKFERNISLEYYHVTCIGKTKHTGKRGQLRVSLFSEGLQHADLFMVISLMK